ncbi:MAG: hypothetical protein B7Y25_06520 [Alphaproteobacteria bacterium 16-39-46]|nr:MAG: hypothetical protein B7Y25_06520 [Alphaproteobacteria bacterium 16-39-46]OZA42292.1 MAG: hypothetical protein B7X84_06595 [Alphaproteobacteria bacterium 17-39-52]HQS84039.1 DUF2975 domain-containing protein [Alphaproteobacteria bacterium]HQS93902.1 DUF2975 domain-containing protein [Alphaproteobacteria bacterium]
MNRIQKISTYLLAIFNLLLWTLPLSSMLLWFFIDTSPVRNLLARGIFLNPVQTPEGLINLAYQNWTPLSKTIGFIGSVIDCLPLFLSLFVLKSIFKNYQKGEIFISQNALYYKRLGIFFFLDALLAKPLSGMLQVLAVTCSNEPGHRYITFSLGTPNLEDLFCGLLIIVISWVMLEASKLQDDQKFTI